MADRQRGTRLLLPTTSPLWGVAEDFFWKRESPFLPDYSLKGEEDRCEEDCRENCLAGPLWAEELEHGGRRDGVVDEEALRCGLNKDKSRVAEQAASTDEEEKRELVWKNGSKSKFFFCASETEGTTRERRSCLLFRVTKVAFEVEARSHTATGL